VWSEYDKLAVLGSYLQPYMRVMRKQDWSGGVHYIDGFAGTGEPQARGEDRLVAGSPRIALDLSQTFDTYTFIDSEAWRVEHLRALCARYPHLTTEVILGDCNEVIPERVTPVVRWEHYARGFAFLDPFALQLQYSTIEAIAETRAIEVVINVATLAMNRNGLPNDPRKLTQAHIDRMDGAWGDHSWFDLIYPEQPGLLGPERPKVGQDQRYSAWPALRAVPSREDLQVRERAARGAEHQRAADLLPGARYPEPGRQEDRRRRSEEGAPTPDAHSCYSTALPAVGLRRGEA
jgi:three-Cys-motif partner protein